MSNLTNNASGKSTVVKVDLQFTRNLGNYESLKIGIGIEDFQRSNESIDDATNRVYAFVEKKLIEKVGEIEKELKGNK
jgi:argininosuccinate lyase